MNLIEPIIAKPWALFTDRFHNIDMAFFEGEEQLWLTTENKMDILNSGDRSSIIKGGILYYAPHLRKFHTANLNSEYFIISLIFETHPNPKYWFECLVDIFSKYRKGYKPTSIDIDRFCQASRLKKELIF